VKSTFEHLARFFETFISLNFWTRLFTWSKVRAQSYSAYEQFKTLLSDLERVSSVKEEAERSVAILSSEKENLKSHSAALENELRKRIMQQEAEITQLKQRIDGLVQERSATERENVALRQSEEARMLDYEKRVSALNALQQRILEERRTEQEERNRSELERLRRMKESWVRHQEEVRVAIRQICQKYVIEFVENVPFKGNPDNTIRVCDEFVVFDAKSPAGDDLANFPHYIKSQAEAVRKYVKEEGVRKELFLVIPSNTVDVIERKCFNMADYTVYVITLDALEPIILSLKRLEDYKFVDELSPDEREDICRLIGKFAHVAKRRIQIDHFFAWELLDVLTRCKTALPRDMLERVLEFERAEKLNPPQERRSKQILTHELEEDALRIQKEAEAKAIVFPPALKEEIKGLPLFETDQS
jgi:hypothetical protein